ncbi:MAG TPA: GntR family transcriptional regulator [Thermodesulfobacteriota bacterium]
MSVPGLAIDKRSPFSIHRQLTAQLGSLIRSGSLKPGEQLPTVRQLAGYLRINHNTVAIAYRELEAQGLLRVEQGRGTFVAESIGSAVDARHAEVMAAVREAFDRVRALGVTAREFLDAATAVAQAPEGGTTQAHVLLVECNAVDLDDMRDAFATELGARLSIATVEELAARIAAGRQALGDVDLAVTTFFHVNEVEGLLEGTGIKVAGLYMGPSIQTLMRIMALDEQARIAAVGVSPVCARGLVTSLRNVIGPERPIAFAHIVEPEGVPQALAGADVVVYADGSQSIVEPLLAPGQQRILVEKQIDRGSIEMVKELAADLVRRKLVPAGGAV